MTWGAVDPAARQTSLAAEAWRGTAGAAAKEKAGKVAADERPRYEKVVKQLSAAPAGGAQCCEGAK